MSRDPRSPAYIYYATLRYENNENSPYYGVVTDPNEDWFGKVITAKEVTWYGADNCPKRPEMTFDMRLDDDEGDSFIIPNSHPIVVNGRKIKVFHTKHEALELSKKLTRLVPVK